ncbi:hypothetical protein R1flu_016876 [Riccia fluitans]|uniref:Uncharacterized protein n=1 Tax=Riccia fluitans TaxID=41844 RepID=A0ABD1YNG4_9MARC
MTRPGRLYMGRRNVPDKAKLSAMIASGNNEGVPSSAAWRTTLTLHSPSEYQRAVESEPRKTFREVSRAIEKQESECSSPWSLHVASRDPRRAWLIRPIIVRRTITSRPERLPAIDKREVTTGRHSHDPARSNKPRPGSVVAPGRPTNRPQPCEKYQHNPSRLEPLDQNFVPTSCRITVDLSELGSIPIATPMWYDSAF